MVFGETAEDELPNSLRFGDSELFREAFGLIKSFPEKRLFQCLPQTVASVFSLFSGIHFASPSSPKSRLATYHSIIVTILIL